jgi:hypothetical protein
MASKDEIMTKILELVSKGAGVALTSDEESDLRKRYYDWIGTKKTGVPTSPQDIWDTKEGERLQKQIEKIGHQMARQKTPQAQSPTMMACATVESLSDCPHCPDPPPG